MGIRAIQSRCQGKVRHYILTGLLLATAFVAGVAITRRPKAGPAILTTHPANDPTTAPATKPVAEIRSYLDVVRATYPSFPATQPLDWPTNLDEAARIVIANPLYVERPGPRGDLWITSRDAPPNTTAKTIELIAMELIVAPSLAFWGGINLRQSSSRLACPAFFCPA
jgi:hypothetical protein